MMRVRTFFRRPRLVAVVLAVFSALLLGLLLREQPAAAQGGSPLHPQFPLLDADGQNVLDSGAPISTMNTCGGCHDAVFIAGHSFHVDAGLSALGEPGAAGGHSWDLSPGLFGEWDPLTYRYLSPQGAQVVDLTTAEWIQTLGARHVGGGPATTARSGEPLVDLPPSTARGGVETTLVDPATGALLPWDWQASGTVEMNCFLCHTVAPDNAARSAALAAGEFGWANTATLNGSGIVSRAAGGWTYDPERFADDGSLLPGALAIQDPTNENCGSCHGAVHDDARLPLTVDVCSTDAWTTLTTGQVFSPQDISQSALNIEGKETLNRSWDVHTERVLDCTDCHYALNNPVYYQEDPASRPDHLVFDPRRLDLGEYLYRPLHEFAKGASAQGDLAPEFDNSLRRCESCHESENTHTWLPYEAQHTQALACETCHVPRLYAPAAQAVDWTVLQPGANPVLDCRGVSPDDPTLITGYEPTLLPRTNADGSTSLAPFNLVSAWYWIYGEPASPVPLRNLEAAYFDGSAYAAAVVTAFDANGDRKLDESELVLDSEAKEALIRSRLADQGLQNPRIVAEIQPYSINHNVTQDGYATRECAACHSADSRIVQPLVLGDRLPGGIVPTFAENSVTALNGAVAMEGQQLVYRPVTAGDANTLYVLGQSSVGWIDWLGILLFVGTVAGVSVHSGLRYLAARRAVHSRPALRRVYMYSVYERLWHWLQTTVILGLIFTGLIIHKPDMFGIFSFPFVVGVHNILAAILVINATLAAFYHLASGEIRQYLPQPRGFFNDAIEQAGYYLRGIFRGEPHPFDKTRDRKMNPLQQVTYLAILNVLLPLQIITGALMWGTQTWPVAAARLGGLPFLAPFHTLVAWSFATFVILHVYLTTTGHTPLANIKAMMLGWDDVEVHSAPSEEVPAS